MFPETNIEIRGSSHEVEGNIEILRKLTVFLELRSRKTLRFLQQIMSADKYPSIFSRQMEAIVYISHQSEVVSTQLIKSLI